MLMGKLAGRYAIVTGAGKGIGKAAVQRLLEDGAAGVAILEYDAAQLDTTVKELDPEGKRLIGVACDVADRGQVEQAIQNIHARFGRIDILVNNAGITRDAMFHKMSEEQWDTVLNVNLNSMFNTCRHVVPIMREQNYGKIVNIASTSAFGNAGQANYAASKAAAIGFTKTLARECGAKNITANCIAPGYIMTDMLAAVPQEILESYKKGIPMRRFGRPEELASVIAFLCSEDSSFLSGQCLVVNGATPV